MPPIVSLAEVRQIVLADALDRSFKDGRVQQTRSDGADAFRAIRRELGYAALCAYEFADSAGPGRGQALARDYAVAALQRDSEQFAAGAAVGGMGGPGPYFALVPFTRALLSLRPHMEADWMGRMIDRAAALFDNAARRDRTHEYLNARALEADSCLGLYNLTGRRDCLDRCQECLDNLLARQYPCGAQMYHSGTWVWGRRPAQVYQFLSASMMLHCARQLCRQDVEDYVRRIMDYSLLATNRRGEAFIAVFEGLHKSRSAGAAGRQWVIASALGNERFQPLACATYRLWSGNVLAVTAGRAGALVQGRMESFDLEPLVEALHLNVTQAPSAEPFVPRPGLHAMEDISTVFVHRPKLDLAMSLLSGYSAFAEADCGDVKLFALTPELTDSPTYRNAGADSLRGDWHRASEQIRCDADGATSTLSGWVYTKWEDRGDRKDFDKLHTRRLEVTMTCRDGEMVLEYRTVKRWRAEPVPSRLLFLLIARPASASPRLRIGREVDAAAPPAESRQPFFIEAGVGPVRFEAPDGSAIEIVPEVCRAVKVTAERPDPAATAPGDNRTSVHVKPANEGSLRLAFEGPDVLDEGRYRIRFLPA